MSRRQYHSCKPPSSSLQPEQFKHDSTQPGSKHVAKHRMVAFDANQELHRRAENQKQSSRANGRAAWRPSPGFLNRGLELRLGDAFRTATNEATWKRK